MSNRHTQSDKLDWMDLFHGLGMNQPDLFNQTDQIDWQVVQYSAHICVVVLLLICISF